MKRIYIVLIVFVLALLGILAASAQSGNGYTLSWSTVAGGGHTWSTGDGYTLGGAISQPDAQAPASSDGYSLQGGFWHPVCLPQAVAVTITCIGSQARLSWMADDANMAYDIYRATAPYVAPVLANKRASTTGPSWTDPTANTCGDAATNYCYVVRATCIGAHADAGETAEFDFGLAPGD